MKVLIHTSGIGTSGGGLRHLTNFLPALAEQDQKNEYVVLLRESVPTIGGHANIRFERVAEAQASGWVARVMGDIVQIPRRLRLEKFDAVVSLANFGPVWTSVPHILFQRNALYYSDYYLTRVGTRLKTETSLRRRMAIEAMKRAELIVTPSDAMADIIKAYCPQVTNRRFRTLYHGFQKSSLQEPLETKYQTLFEREGKKLLYPSAALPHKGFEILFDILANLKGIRDDFTFFAPVSNSDWPDGVRDYERRVRDLGLADHVVFIGRIPQSQMGALYEQCDVMVYPSLCESFGFPLIEAMACGIPIVASKTAVNEELCREAAIYYPAEDAIAGAIAINEALNPAVASELNAQGAYRINKFDWSWQRYAKEFLNLVQSAA